MTDDLEVALRAALAGARLGMSYFARVAEISKERKPDGSLVTEADRAVEVAIREVISAERPADAVLGEEGGLHGTAARRWIVDPIDGTAGFAAGDDRWLNLVALEVDGQVVVAVATVPAQNLIWYAQRGAGAFVAELTDAGTAGAGRSSDEGARPEPAKAGTAGAGRSSDEGARSEPAKAGTAGAGRSSDEGARPEPAKAGTAGARRISVSDRADVAASRFGVVPEPAATPEDGWIVAGLSAVTKPLPWSVHPALLVASGELDLAVQTRGMVWDYAAPSLIVTEAGGRFSDHTGPAVYAATGALHQAARDLMPGAPS